MPKHQEFFFKPIIFAIVNKLEDCFLISNFLIFFFWLSSQDKQVSALIKSFLSTRRQTDENHLSSGKKKKKCLVIMITLLLSSKMTQKSSCDLRVTLEKSLANPGHSEFPNGVTSQLKTAQSTLFAF